MKKSFGLILVVLAAACQNDPFFRDEDITSLEEKLTSSNNAKILSEFVGICNEKITIPLMVSEGSPVIGPTAGRIECIIGPERFHIDYFTEETWFLKHVRTWIGNCEGPFPNSADFPFQQEFSVADEVHSFSVDIPVAEMESCGCLFLNVKVISWYSKYDEEPSLAAYEYEFLQEYCLCDGAVTDDKNLHTQSQGGWGTSPHGNNPGSYLQANFESAFPDGLIVGCKHTLTLTSAEAVRDFLPQGGKPAPLSRNYVEAVRKPKDTNTLKNVLAGQVVALKLSIVFDEWDEGFGESATNLRNAVIAKGMFKGWTVAEVLAEAEKVLGDCNSTHTASQLNDALSAINESFVDGKNATGFLQNHK